VTGAPGEPSLAQPAVEVNGLRFAYDAGAPPVLDIPSLRIRAGERVFLQGPSGSGKSTLLSLLAGVLVPETGSVCLNGMDLGALSGPARDRYRADHLGFVFQMFNLVPYLSLLDNVTLPCAFSRRRAGRASERAGSVAAEARRLLDRLELLDLGDGQRVTRLSIGQQQRVALARALIGAPELLIADEPTSALDEGTRERFLSLLFNECDQLGTTVVLVSHDRRLGALFQRQVSLAEVNHAARAQ
jgi:putative ABC transport system ATP-binding protein